MLQTENANNKSVEILLIENDENDVVLIKKAFNQAKLTNNISVAANGTEALQFLRRTGKFSAAPHPDLVLLDLALPPTNGHAVLAEIKKDPALRHIPVIVLSSSMSPKDVILAYDNYANSYITKPLHVEDFMKAVIKLADFWFTVVKLPPKKALPACQGEWLTKRHPSMKQERGQ